MATCGQVGDRAEDMVDVLEEATILSRAAVCLKHLARRFYSSGVQLHRWNLLLVTHFGLSVCQNFDWQRRCCCG